MFQRRVKDAIEFTITIPHEYKVGHGLSTGGIVGIAIAGAFVLLLILHAICVCKRRMALANIYKGKGLELNEERDQENFEN